MSKVVFESRPREEACQRCQKLGFVNIFASLDDKETHGKLHLGVDYELQTENPPPSTELMRQILDSCFPCLEERMAIPTASSTKEPLKEAGPEKPMELLNEEPTGSSPSDQEEKPILDECLLCGFRCLQSECLEQHWSHVALEHLERPDIFGCSQCDSAWDTTKPFGEHLLLYHPGQQASLLDRRDLGACNIFQICFGASEERLATAGLKHLFQTPIEQTTSSTSKPLPPRPPQDKQFIKPQTTFAAQKQLRKKTKDRCLVCGHQLMYFRPEKSRYRWTHVATCHLESPHIFACSICHKGWHWTSNFKRHVREKHPERNSPTSGMLLRDKRTAKDWQLYHTCFGECTQNSVKRVKNTKTRPPPPPPTPPKRKQRKAKFRKSCSLCRYQLPFCHDKSQRSLLRWQHLSKHADGRPLFYCPLCKKGGKHLASVAYYCRKNHPDMKVRLKNWKELSELHESCFLNAVKIA